MMETNVIKNVERNKSATYLVVKIFIYFYTYIEENFTWQYSCENNTQLQ